MATAKTEPDIIPYERVQRREPKHVTVIPDDPAEEPENDEPLSRAELRARLLRDRCPKKRR